MAGKSHFLRLKCQIRGREKIARHVQVSDVNPSRYKKRGKVKLVQVCFYPIYVREQILKLIVIKR